MSNYNTIRLHQGMDAISLYVVEVLVIKLLNGSLFLKYFIENRENLTFLLYR